MSYRYFAYGSAMNPEHFAEWARDHGHPTDVLGDGQPAVLDDHELAINVPSRYWMGAVGTLEPKQGATVYGVLFEVDAAHADVVRHKEGVATGLYREIEVEVRLWTPGGDDTTMQLMTASAFIVAEGRAAAAPPPPSQKWLDIVIAGAQRHGLPELWIAELKRKARR
jgi:cation transport regulator ChaC